MLIVDTKKEANMDNDKLSKWAAAAGIRAVRTIAQTAIGFITVGACLSDINWTMMFSVSAVAGLYSIFTSIITGLPEVKE